MSFKPAVLGFFCLALAGSLVPVRAASPTVLDRLDAEWAGMHDYSVTIDAFEAMGSETDEHELHYAFRKPDRARLDVVKGTRSGTSIVWSGGDRVTAYKRAFSLFKMHGGVWDKNLTSLRGNGVLSPNMGTLLACFDDHRSIVKQREGPVVDGEPTDELELPYADFTCPEDPVTDRGAVTRDVIDVSRRSTLIIERRRYAGATLIERWDLKDYKIDSGLDDGALS